MAVRSLDWTGPALLALAVGGGIGVIVAIRRWLKGASSGADRGDWENTLARYKNLRDEGVLSEEEFRKVRTLVAPRTRSGMPEPRERPLPPTEPFGPE